MTKHAPTKINAETPLRGASVGVGRPALMRQTSKLIGEPTMRTNNRDGYTIDDARAMVDNEIPGAEPETRERTAQEVMQKVREEGEGPERALMQIRGLGCY